MNKNIFVGLIVIAIIAIGGYYFPQVKGQLENIGAVPTLDGVDNPYLKINGASYYYYSQPMVATSSTVCSIRNPFGNATSTLVNYSFEILANGLGAQSVSLSTSTTQFASSSPYYIKEYAVGAGQASVVWMGNSTTTNTSLIGNAVGNNIGNSNNIIGPNLYLNLGISTSTPIAGTFSSYYTGKCSGIIKKV